MFKTDRFYCFSPPAMLATFVIEIGLAIYTVTRYKMSPAIRLTTALLLMLALFQLAEYSVCGRSSAAALVWSRIGFVAITMLPPLSIHLVLTVAKRSYALIKWLAYSTSLLFISTFAFSSTAFVGHICAGNYAIFQLVHPVGGLYFTYYYLWVMIGTGLSLYLSLSATQRVREALILQVCGYLSFLLPTGIVNAIDPRTIVAIPSVMCGFAVTYAVILAIGIVPITSAERKKVKAT